LLKLDELHSTIEQIIGHDQLNYAKVQGSRRELEMFLQILVMRERFHGINGSKPAANLYY
jgi:hypothetical protein